MKKENIRKVILAILFVLILVVIALFIGRFTYSYLGPAPTDELTGTGEVTPSGDTIIFSKGNDLSLSASTDNFHTGSGNLTDTTNPQVRLIASSDTNDASTTYFAGIRIYENTYSYSTDNNTAELILSVYDENGTLLEASSDTLSFVEVNGVKGFDITGLTGAYNIAIDHPISTTSSTNGTTHTWTFTLTFVNLDTDQSINETANLNMEVVLQKDRIEPPTMVADICESGDNLASCIAEFNALAGDGAEGVYYHDADLANGAEDNGYRYSGANPNNYVCFGSTTTPCPAENLYRIIGVLNDNGEYQVKLIKSDYTTSAMLGTDGRDYNGSYVDMWGESSDYKGNMTQSDIAIYRWNYDTSVSREGTNNWTTSEFNTINLNTNYWNYLGATWQNLIAPTTWHLGGMTSTSNIAKAFYDGERNNAGYGSNPTTYTDEIGLMYVSDYGYAAYPDAWTTNLNFYNNSSITSNNWLYMGLYEWTITPYSSYSNNVFYLYNSGFLDFYNANRGYSVRPVFYLNSNVEYNGGTGTESDPFTLVV